MHTNAQIYLYLHMTSDMYISQYNAYVCLCCVDVSNITLNSQKQLSYLI